MDSCDEWLSWRHISGFSLTCRNVASSNGKRAKYCSRSAMKNKHLEIAFKHSCAISEQILTPLTLSSVGRTSVFSALATWRKCTCFTAADVSVYFLNLVGKKLQHSIKAEATEQSERALCACVVHLGWMGRIFEVAWGHLAAQWELGTQLAATFAQCSSSKEVQRKAIGRLLFTYWRLICLWIDLCILVSWLAQLTV